ncbi:Rhs family protein [Hahella chejuensis KCTC 2396]|uniref:Rhs family protein n=1 Tax=Hahella chejuensis (strain KCTC 2396) TaxID=349521 RepID=Q2SEZ7_HAHCH|nr:LysM peptidoglycan-binding domain-containing protein [Hahella chejuensis]ABC30777.1 Rhs family protein [Hahella chejuensis KCTC 2396]
MVAVVSGEGLGLFGASLSGAGAGLSQAGVGQSGERVYVNAATGNLVLQRRDELLLGAGRDASLIRTYNSQGRFTDDNGDNFYFSFNQRLEFNGGNLNKAGSLITRIAGDGSRTDYHYDESRGLYVSSVGEGAHDTLEFRGGTGSDAFLWTEGESGAQEVYSWQGKLSALAHRDEPGRVTISRSAAATTLTTASGEKLEIQYDGAGRAVLVKTVGADGAQRNQTYYGYDAQGRLTTVTVDLTPADNSIGDGRTFVTRYSYDGDSKRVAKMQASDGVSVSFQYQDIGGEYRVTRVTQGDGADAIVTTYAYDLAQRTATVTRVLDPVTLSGLQTVLRYDERTRLVEMRLPQQDGTQSVRRYAYDADDNLIQSTDADGHSETYRYDAMGNLLTHTDRLGGATDYTYNAHNQTLTETTDGATQRYVYDSAHRLRYRVDAEGGVTEFRYNHLGQLTATQGYLARYDLSGLSSNQALSEGPLNTWAPGARAQGTSLTEYAYDFRGQLSRQTRYSKTDATGAGIGAATTHFIYDAEGRLLKQVNPEQAAPTENAGTAPESLGHRTGETLYVYDGLGRLLSVKDALGAVTTQTEYQGATILSRDAAGLQSVKTYNSAGALIDVVERDAGGAQLGKAQQYYDAQGRVIRSVDAQGAQTRYVYDGQDRVRFEIDALGYVTENRYDALGRVTQTRRYEAAYGGADVNLTALETFAAGQSAITTRRFYDAAGQMRFEIDAQGYVTGYEYDGQGRVAKKTRYDKAADLNAANLASLAAHAPSWRGDGVVQIDAGRIIKTAATGLSGGRAVANETLRQGRGALEFTVAALPTGASLGAVGFNKNPETVLTGNDYLNEVDLGVFIRDPDGAGSQGHSLMIQVNGVRTEPTSATPIQVGDRLRIEMRGADARILLQRPGQHGFTLIQTLTGVVDANANYTAQTNLYGAGAAIEGVALSGDADYHSAGVSTRYVYDAKGQARFEVDAQGYVTENRYDALGRVTEKLSYSHAYTGGVFTESALQTFANGEAPASHSRLVYDARGQVRFEVDALGYVTEFEYDAQGRVVNKSRYEQPIDVATADLASRLPQLLNWGADAEVSLQGGRLTRTGPASLTAGRAIAGSGLTGGEGVLEFTVDQLVNGQSLGVVGFNLNPEERLSGNDYFKEIDLGVFIRDRDGAAAEKHSVLIQYKGTQIAPPTMQFVEAGDRFRIELKDGDARILLQRKGQDKYVLIHTLEDAVDATQTYVAQANLYAQGAAIGDVWMSGTATQNSERSRERVVYDAKGQARFTIDALGQVTENRYDALGRVTETSRHEVTVDVNRAWSESELVVALGQVIWTDVSSRLEVNGSGVKSLASLSDWTEGARSAQVIRGEGYVEFSAAPPQQRVIVGLNSADTMKSYQDIDYGLLFNISGEIQIREEGVWKQNLEGVTQHPDNRYRIVMKDGRVHYYVRPAGQSEYQEAYVSERLPEADKAYFVDASFFDAGAELRNVALTPEGIKTRYVYDAKGQVRFTLDVLGQVTENRYDALGGVTEKLSYSHAYTGGVFTESALQTFANGATPASHSRLVYDARGQVRFEVDALGYVTEFEYDAQGRAVNKSRYEQPIDVATADLASRLPQLLNWGADAEVSLQGGRLTRTGPASLTAGRAVAGSGLSGGEGVLEFTVDQLVNGQSLGVVGFNLNPEERLSGNDYFKEIDLGVFIRDRDGAAAEKHSVLIQYKGTQIAPATMQFVEAGDRFRIELKDGDARILLQRKGQDNYVLIHTLKDAVDASQTYVAQANLYAQGSAIGDVWMSGTATQNSERSRERLVYDVKGQARFTIDALGQVTENRYDALGRVTETSRHEVTVDVNRAWSESELVVALGQVIWTDVSSRLEVNGSGVKSLASLSDWTEGARSAQVIRGEGYVEFSAAPPQQRVIVGLNSADTMKSYQDIDYGLLFNSSGEIQIREEGVWKQNLEGVTQHPDNRYRIVMKNGRVHYYVRQAGQSEYQEAYVSERLPEADKAYFVDASFHDAGAELRNVALTPEGIKTRYVYDAKGQARFTLDALGQVTENRYDALGQVAEKLSYDRAYVGPDFSEAALTQFANAQSQPRSGCLVYDAKGQARFEIDALGHVTEREYDAAGRVTATHKYLNPLSLAGLVYDEAGIESKLSAAGGRHTQRTVYDARGLARFSLNALGQVTETRYDAAGRATQTLRYETAYSGADYSEAALAQFVAGETRAQHAYMVYDSLGQARFKLDHQGHITELEYDHNGQVTRTLSYVAAYDLSQPLTAAALETYVQGHASAGDRVEQVFYDARGLEIYRIDAGGRLTAQEYDHAGRLTHRVRYAASLNLGTAATLTQVTQAADAHRSVAANQHSRLVYDALGRLRYSLDGENYVSETLYNGQGQVTEERRYAAPWTQAATLSALTGLHPDAETRITRYAYDDAGRKISQSQRLMTGGAETWITESYAYDAHGNRTAVTDARGNVTSFAYDADNRLIAKLTPKDAIDDADISASARKGAVTRYQYDGFDNLIQESQYVTEVSIHERTAADYATANVPANNDPVSGDRHTRYEYDALNRQERIRTPELNGVSTLTRKEYDRYGNVTALIEAEGSALERTTRYEFDDLNRVVKETKAFGTANASSTGYVYDAFGQVERVIDPRAYEILDSQSDWAKGERARLRLLAENYQANPAGLWQSQQAQWLKDNALLLSFLSREHLPEGEHRALLLQIYSKSQTFDARGLKTSETNGEGYTTHTQYDAFGNITSVTDPNGATGYFFYDALNRQTLQVSAGGAAKDFTYNAAGQVIAQRSWANRINAASLAGKTEAQARAMLTVDAAHDQFTRSDFDSLGRLKTQTAQATSAQQVSESYSYDAQGNRISWTDRGGHVYAYRYDAQGRLLETIKPSVRVTFNADASLTGERRLSDRNSYDALGNRIRVVEGGYRDADGSYKTISGQTRATEYVYDKLNREVQVWSDLIDIGFANDAGEIRRYNRVRQVTQREYDALGNQLKETVQAFQVDGANRPTTAVGAQRTQLFEYDNLSRVKAAVDAAGGVTAYDYDPSGNRILERRYGEALSNPGNAALAALLSKDTDDYRELRYTFDLNNRQVETRTRGETHFDLALSNQQLAALTQGESAVSKGFYSSAYSQEEVVTQTLYNRNGDVIAERDGRGGVTRHFYTAQGDLQATLAAGVTDYQREGGAVTVTRRHALTQWTTDALGQIREQVQYAYEAKNPAETATLAELLANVAAQRAAAESDAAKLAGRDLADLADLSDAEVAQKLVRGDRRQTYDYDRLGRRITETVHGVEDYQFVNGAPKKTTASSRSTRYDYDNLNRLQRTIAPGEGAETLRTLETTYDALGRKTTEKGQSFTDYKGRMARATVTYGYDALGRQVTQTRVALEAGANQTTRTLVNALGFAVADIDASSARTDYATDAFGAVAEKSWSQRQAEGGSQSYWNRYWYDGAGREIKRVDTTGLSHETRYNGYGDITAKGMNGQYQEQFKYDRLGRLFSTNKETGAPQLYLYDKNGNASAEFILVDDLKDASGKAIDLATLTSPEQVKALGVLQTQMKVSVYDERNRHTDTFEAPHDYSQLEADILKSNESITDWKSDADWQLGVGDVEKIRFEDSVGPAVTGADSAINTSLTQPPHTEEVTVSGGKPGPVTQKSNVTDLGANLSGLMGHLGISPEAWSKSGSSYGAITLNAATNSYASAWKGEGPLEKVNGAFEKTIIRIWNRNENGITYIYRDVETQRYILTSNTEVGAEQIVSINVADEDGYQVNTIKTRDGEIKVTGYRTSNHDAGRFRLENQVETRYSDLSSVGPGIIQAVKQSKITIDAKEVIRGGHPGGQGSFSFKVNIPEELGKLGMPVRVTFYDQYNRAFDGKWDPLTPEMMPEFRSTAYWRTNDDHEKNSDWDSYKYKFKVTIPSLSGEEIFYTNYITNRGDNHGTFNKSLSGLTNKAFLIIEDANPYVERLTGSIGGVDLSTAQRLGNNRFLVRLSNGQYDLSYATWDSTRKLNEVKTFINLTDMKTVRNTNIYFKALKTTTHRQLVYKATATPTSSNQNALEPLVQENDQQQRIFQSYRTMWTLGGQTTYQIHRQQRYNAFGEVVQEVDGRGNATHLAYDAQGRLTHKIDPKVEVSQDHAVNGVLKSLNAHPITRYFYDASGNLVANQDANSYLAEKKAGYSISNNAAFYRGQTYSAGMVASETNALGHGKTYRYDQLGNKRLVIDELDQYHSFVYDSVGRLTEVRRFENLAKYNAGDSYTSDKYSYDELGNRVTHTNARGHVEKYVYDGEGRIVKHIGFNDGSQGGGANETSYEYRYVSSIGGIGGYKKVTTNGLSTETDANYKTTSNLTDETDYFGRIRTHQDLGGHQFVYEYNRAGWLQRQSTSNSAYTYTDGDIPAELLSDDSHPTRGLQDIQYEYYANGRVRRISDKGAGSYSEFKYDANGNVEEETYRRSPFTELDSIVGAGLEQNSLPYQNVRATYDALNRVVSIRDDDYDLTYSYDAVGNRRHMKSIYDDYLITDKNKGEDIKTQDFYYLYDKENRFIVTMGALSAGATQSIYAGNTGHEIGYDQGGRRIMDNSALLNKDGAPVESHQKFEYDAYGRVRAVWLKDARLNGKTGEGVRADGYARVAVRETDELGRTTTHSQYSHYLDAAGAVKERLESLHHYDYNANNQVLKDTAYKDASMSDSSRKSILTYTYLNDGQTLKQTFFDDLANNKGDVTTTYHYLARDRWDSYKASKVTVSASVGAGASYYIYDANGHTRWVYDHQDKRTISYVNNQRGQAIQRNEIDWNKTGQEKSIRRKFYYLDGIVRGDIGNDGVPSRTDYVQQLAENGDHSVVVGQESYSVTRYAGRDDNRSLVETRTRDIKKKVGYSSYYRMTPVTSADFDQNFQPINYDYPSKASSFYEVNQGDKLSSIAASMWGDASLWYLLADANGLSGDQDLKAGLSLVIPNVVTNIHNNASTFRPYDPGLGLGDTTPSLPEPPPPKKGKCGATFIVMVIAIAVAAVIAPYAIQGAVSLFGATTGAVGSGVTLIAGTTGIGTLGATTGIVAGASGYAAVAAGAFVSGAIGSAASQWAAKELGVQEHFSLRGVLRSGLTAAATAGVAAYANTAKWAKDLPKWAKNAATAVTGVGANYLAGKATKLPATFRWRDVATSFAANSLMSGIGIGDENAFYNQGLSSYVDGFLPGSIRNNDIARNAIQGFTAGAVSEAVRVAVYDSEDYRPDYVGMIAGVVGSTLGSLAVDGLAGAEGRKGAWQIATSETEGAAESCSVYGQGYGSSGAAGGNVGSLPGSVMGLFDSFGSGSNGMRGVGPSLRIITDEELDPINAYKQTMADANVDHSVRKIVDSYFLAMNAGDSAEIEIIYKSLEPYIPEEAKPMAGLGVGAFLAVGSITSDTVADTFNTAEMAVKFGVGAIDYALYEITKGNRAFQEGAKSFRNDFQGFIDFLKNIDRLPKDAAQKYKDTFDKADGYWAEKDYVGAGRYYTEGAVGAVLLGASVGTFIKTLPKGVIYVESKSEIPLSQRGSGKYQLGGQKRDYVVVLNKITDIANLNRSPITSNSLVVDNNITSAILKRENGVDISALNKAERNSLLFLDSKLNADIRLTDTGASEALDSFSNLGSLNKGIELTVSRDSPEFQQMLDTLKNLKGPNGDPLPVGRNKGAKDQMIVAEAFFARGGQATLVTADQGVFSPLAVLAGHNPAKLGVSVPNAFPNGFNVTVNGKSILVLPIKGK